LITPAKVSAMTLVRPTMVGSRCMQASQARQGASLSCQLLIIPIQKDSKMSQLTLPVREARDRSDLSDTAESTRRSPAVFLKGSACPLLQVRHSSARTDRSLGHLVFDVSPYSQNKLDSEVQHKDHHRRIDEELKVSARVSLSVRRRDRLRP
jgi:hypothetical protein